VADLGTIGAALNPAGPDDGFSGTTMALPSITNPPLPLDLAYGATPWQVTDTKLYLADIDISGIISGKVYLDNVILPNQQVELYHHPSRQLLAITATDSSGLFTFYGLEKAAGIYYVQCIYQATYGGLKVVITPDAFIEIGLYSVAARRPLVLINGRITEAPDGTTWAVGVPAALGTYSSGFGDGASSSYTFTHNLNTRDLIVEVRENTAPYAMVDVQWEATSVNTITVNLSTTPSFNTMRVNVLAL